MVELQRLTGMRPGEVVIMRTLDLDTSGKVWLYRLESHKTEHHGHERAICSSPAPLRHECNPRQFSIAVAAEGGA